MNEPMTQEQWEAELPKIKPGDRIVFRDQGSREGTEYEAIVWRADDIDRLRAGGWWLDADYIARTVAVIEVKHWFTPNQYMVVGDGSAGALAFRENGEWWSVGSVSVEVTDEMVSGLIASGVWIVLHEGVTS